MTTARPRRTAILLFTCVALVAAGCAGEDDGGGPVTAALERIPGDYVALAGDSDAWLEVRFSDLARAAEIAGFDAPAPGRDDEAFLTDFAALTGTSEPGRPYVLLPASVSTTAFVESAAVEAETGISMGAVETVTEIPGTPISFTAFTGDLSLGGELVADGDMWVAGDGEELEPNLDERSALRELGRPRYLAARDGAVAMSTSRAVTESWLGDRADLADDERFAALAEVLDEYEPYTAALIRGDFSTEASSISTSPERADEQGLVPDVGPYSHVGIAEFDDDGTPRTIVAYLFADDDAAAAAIEPLSAAWENLQSPIEEDDLSGIVSAVNAETSGPALVLLLDDPEAGATLFAWQLLASRMPVFTYRLS